MYFQWLGMEMFAGLLMAAAEWMRSIWLTRNVGRLLKLYLQRGLSLPEAVKNIETFIVDLVINWDENAFYASVGTDDCYSTGILLSEGLIFLVDSEYFPEFNAVIFNDKHEGVGFILNADSEPTLQEDGSFTVTIDAAIVDLAGVYVHPNAIGRMLLI